MSRHEFSSRTKAIAALRANGRCESCKCKLRTGYIEFDHEIPDGIGGENVPENCRCLCRSCHATKTKKDRGTIAKASRNFRKSHGIKPVSRFQTSRTSKWKKKLNGQLVLR